MKKTIVFGSIFVISMIVMMPTISATHSLEETENLINSLNDSDVSPNFPVNLLELRNNVASGGPIYNLLSRIIFWIGIILGIWPYQ